MPVRKLLTVLFFTLLWLRCGAMEPAAPDFSEGFALIDALEIPQISPEATWTKIPDQTVYFDYHIRDYLANLKGNGWSLPSGHDEPTILRGLGSLDNTEIPQNSHFKAKKVDLRADVEKLIESIQQARKEDSPEYFLKGYGNFSSEEAGPFFIFAVQLHQHGDAELANQLVNALFLAAPNREVVLDSGINLIADQAYSKLIEQFYQSQDWKALHQGLMELVQKFPRGWQARNAVGLLLEPSKARAESQPPRPLTLDGISLDPEAVQSIDWMLKAPSSNDFEIPEELAEQLSQLPASARQQYLSQMSNAGNRILTDDLRNWLLADKKTFDESKSIAVPTLRLGMKAIPVLIALAEDDYLTYFPNSPANSFSMSFDSDLGPVENMQQQLAHLNHPLRRSDIATQLLDAMLPASDDYVREMDASQTKSAALDFWQQHQNDSRDQLAYAYLTSSSKEQKIAAASIIATSSDESLHQKFEAQILNSVSPVKEIETVATYIRKRKTPTTEFFKVYRSAVIAQYQQIEPSEDYELGMDRKMAMEIMKQMGAKAEGLSIQGRARELARENLENPEISIRAFYNSIKEEPLAKQFLAMLAGAKAATEPRTRSYFLAYCINYHSRSLNDEFAPEKNPRKLSSSEKKVWQALLADKNDIPAEMNRYTDDSDTVGQLAAIALETSLEGMFMDFQRASLVLHKSAGELAYERASARLKGKPIPPLPDASRVDASRLEEMVHHAGSLPTNEVHPYLTNLSPDELMAWIDWLEDPQTPAFPQSLQKLRLQIIKRSKGYLSYPDQPGVGNIGVGFEITPQALESWMEEIARNLPDHSRTYINLTSTAIGPGLEILAFRSNLEPAEESETESERPSLSRLFYSSFDALVGEEAPADSTGVIYLELYTADQNFDFPIQIVDGKARYSEFKAPLSDALEAAASSSESFDLDVQILSRADAEAIRAAEDDN
ncbi:hypothetical protein JIN85_04565 [Luteolibacter pohnpeiensis]|uniref:Uncharacterized protein n=1 Tax=Luteolibacter pohnpeiensis TaxID=454153 RepID=A0A934SAA2_9BACT|nr:hypothetical protein [Luteolibacter pohnpeiensis]MBK1881673.1 hypothetical protein [Luteolibacter pohnpeiensis]